MEISGAALFRARPAAIRSPAGKKAIVILSLAAALIVAAFLTPPAAFSIDDVIYIDMARAMAERGSLDITDQNIPAGAPALTKSAGIVHLIDGRAVPQYPAGYGLIAAPFFGLFGVSGLILMNALAGALSLWLTYKIAFRLYRDDRIAANAALILGACTLFAGYVLAIWPHMTALACLLGGAYFALETSIETGRRRMMAALAGGFIFGFGVFFRVDALVPFAAVFFWLRLFALPSSRAPALLFLAGAAPCFLLAAYFNFEKFGAFLPVTYGPNMSGNSSLGAYGPLAVAGLAAMAASLVLDTSHKFIQSVLGCSMRVKLIALTGVMLAGLVLAGDVIGRLLHSLYFLTVDIQAYDAASPQTGLGRDEFGYWSFWGLPKKALLQSLPFAALALLPALAFCRSH
jgi:hypothetical protein